MSKLLITLFLILVFVVFLLPPFDPDLGWQLRCGQMVLEGKNCMINTFTTLLDNFKWAYPIFVYPTILAFIFNNFSFWGVSVLYGFILTAAYFLMYKTLKGDNLLKIGLLLLTIPLSWVVLGLGLRSQIFSILFFALTLFIIDYARTKNFNFIFTIPLIFLFWANTHAGFIPGLAILSFYIVEVLFKKDWNKFLKASGVFLISILATLLTPSGVDIYVLLFEHFHTPLNTLIAEWVSPTIFHWLVIFSVAIWITFWNFRQKNFSLFIILSTLFFVYLGLSARRNLALSYLFLVFALSFSLKDFNLEKFSGIKTLSLTTISAAIGLILLSVVPNTHAVNTNWQEFCKQNPVGHPCEAVEFLRKQEKKGNLFNPYEQGGFLIWQLPEYKIFVDGRMPAWTHPSGKSPYTIYLEVIQAKPGFEEVIKENRTDWMLLGNGTFLDIELQENPRDWIIEEYRDERYVVYQVFLK